MAVAKGLEDVAPPPIYRLIAATKLTFWCYSDHLKHIVTFAKKSWFLAHFWWILFSDNGKRVRISSQPIIRSLCIFGLFFSLCMVFDSGQNYVPIWLWLFLRAVDIWIDFCPVCCIIWVLTIPFLSNRMIVCCSLFWAINLDHGYPAVAMATVFIEKSNWSLQCSFSVVKYAVVAAMFHDEFRRFSQVQLESLGYSFILLLWLMFLLPWQLNVSSFWHGITDGSKMLSFEPYPLISTLIKHFA